MRKMRSFSRSEDGNIAILYAFLLAALMLFTGGAVDFTRRNAVRADLIESLDAAGLAIAKLDEADPPEISSLGPAARDAYLKEYGERFFHENFKYEDLVTDLDLDFELDPQVIRPSAQGKIKTIFLGIGDFLLNGSGGTGLEFLSMNTSTEITRRGSGPIELALVLDVTGSMNETINNVKKIESLRDASDALLDVLFGDDDDATSEFVKVAVVPFNAYVNAGGARDEDGASAWTSTWGDLNAQAIYHGARYLHVTSTSAIDLNTKVNHYRLFESNVGTTWRGCFESRPYPLDELDVAAGSTPLASDLSSYNVAPTGTSNSLVLNAYSTAPTPQLSNAVLSAQANTRFVPNFAPDGVNCNDGSGSNDNCEWSATTSTRAGITYSGNWFNDPETEFSSASYAGSVEESGHEDFGNSWIDDRRFTRVTGTALDKYLPVVNYFRRVLRQHVGGTSSQCPTSIGGALTDNNFYNWLNARGATECFDDEYILRDAYVGTWNAGAQKYENRVNLSPSIDEYLNEATNDTGTRGPNAGCTYPILVQSDEKEAIHDHIHGLSPSGSTNSAEGMMWGWRVLSPEAPFMSDIPYNDNEWQKAVVLMTDGFNFISHQENYRGSGMTAYGFAREARMGVGVDTAAEMKAEIDKKLLRICTRMKQRNILVYAITFGLSDSDPDELAVKQLFQACASGSEAPYYFDAPDGDDLEDAFKDIAADLVKLHVSR
jgi:hypothetical protein